MVDGTVSRIEPYGVFVNLAGGERALLPAAESGTPRGADLRAEFPKESVHQLIVIAVDDQRRFKVSKKQRELADDRAIAAEFNNTQGAGQGFGTLGDLLKAKSLDKKR